MGINLTRADCAEEPAEENSTATEQRQSRTRLDWVVAAAVLLYVLLSGINSLATRGEFTPDSMNYVNVARNYAAGQGLTQPTLGFNVPRFDASDRIPAPFVAQPPLYPISIVAAGRSGIPLPDCALLISALCCAAVLAVGFAIANRVFGKTTAMVSLALLLLYDPLRQISIKACSEPLGILLLLISLHFLTYAREKRSSRLAIAGAGLTAGMALATRYLLAPLYLVGVVFLIAQRKPREGKFRDLAVFTLAFLLPAAIVFAHNLHAIGRVLPPNNLSDIGLWGNTCSAVRVLLGNYSAAGSSAIRFLVPICLVTAFTAAIVNSKSAIDLRNKLWSDDRKLVTLWTGVYLAVLVILRSHTQFDVISPRLIAPAGVTLVILAAAVLADEIKPRMVHVQLGVLALVFALSAGEIRGIVTGHPERADRLGARTSRMQWISNNTTQRDLIIGDDAVDLPFYFPGRETLSFSPYPYTDYLTYAGMTAFCDAHSNRYERYFLIVRTSGKSEREVKQLFGPFIADVTSGRTRLYPRVIEVARLPDAVVFTVTVDSETPPGPDNSQLHRGGNLLRLPSSGH